MAKSNITTNKKNVTTPPSAGAAAPDASRDGATSGPPIGEIAAEVVAAVTAPLIARAGKLKRLIKSKAEAAKAAIQPSHPPSAATPTSPSTPGNGTSAVVPKVAVPLTPVTEAVKAKRVGKPGTPAATPSAKATETAPAPPPPILGVTKAATKVKRPAKPKPATRPAGIQQSKKVGFTAEEVALRAYFIAQRRQAEGRPGSPESDWLQAESELRTESKAPRPA